MKSNVVFRPTVVIGLGGTGFGAVLKLKKHFIDAYAGAVPPIIRFMTIDTTQNVEHSEKARDGSPITLDPLVEQFVLQVANPAGLLGGTNPHIDEWWPSNIPIGAIVAGAGQVRARGRLALFARSGQIVDLIRNAIREVQLIKNQKQMYKDQFLVSERGGVEVYVISSLAGGTGSGMFLDIGFIARHFVDSQSNITGVLVMPSVFTGKAGVNMVKPNAYGALKELEQFSKLGLDYNFTIKYGAQNQVEAKQPPFDLTYLIDSVNEDGRGVKEPSELMSLVAQGVYLQIGSQIGTNTSNTVDNIKTHLSTAGKVRGRSANYCSFGVAKLSLPVRLLEAMEIEAARKLLSDGLLNGAFPDSDLEAEVVRFIQDNRLREDDADDVINALSERDGGGQMRFPLPLGGIKYDRTAHETIKQLHVTHRSRMEQQVSQGLNANFKKLREASLDAVDKWLEGALNRPNGLMYAMRFTEKLLAKLEWYQHMMESEAREEQARHGALNFKTLEEQVRDAGTAFLRRETRVQTACENYKGMVNRECELYVQAARRDKAAELYGALRAHVEELRQRCDRIRLNLEAALKKFEQSFLDATATRGGESPFEHILQFDAEANRPGIEGEEFVKWHNEKFGSLSMWAGMRDEDVARNISTFVKERYQPLTGLPIDDVLRRVNPEQVVRELNQLSHLAVPLWHYNDAKIPIDNRDVISELFHYGVADAEQTVLQDPKISGRIPRQGATDPSFVSTQDTQRIVLFKVKVGVPLFALHDIEGLERAYHDPDKVVSNHVHREWENFPGVIPRAGEGEALRWFAIAQCPPPIGLISRRGDWYYIRSRQAKRTDKGELRLDQGRLKAYEAFEKNAELVKEVKENVDALTRAEGEAKINGLLRQHVETLTAQMSGGNIDPSIKEQVERELEEIDKHLKEMSTIR
ncbi:MAG TPA: tubulin-like doman-containing protein [Pyrinomonadaceae bacterium]|jgi:hypothetical protein